jgi:hypothetical protein
VPEQSLVEEFFCGVGLKVKKSVSTAATTSGLTSSETLGAGLSGRGLALGIACQEQIWWINLGVKVYPGIFHLAIQYV